SFERTPASVTLKRVADPAGSGTAVIGDTVKKDDFGTAGLAPAAAPAASGIKRRAVIERAVIETLHIRPSRDGPGEATTDTQKGYSMAGVPCLDGDGAPGSVTRPAP